MTLDGLQRSNQDHRTFNGLLSQKWGWFGGGGGLFFLHFYAISNISRNNNSGNKQKIILEKVFIFFFYARSISNIFFWNIEKCPFTYLLVKWEVVSPNRRLGNFNKKFMEVVSPDSRWGQWESISNIYIYTKLWC